MTVRDELMPVSEWERHEQDELFWLWELPLRVEMVGEEVHMYYGAERLYWPWGFN